MRRGRIALVCRETLRHRLERSVGCEDVTFAVERGTGWRFVVEELQRVGITALLAEPGHRGSRRASPDHRYYADVTGRIDANRSAMSVARKLIRRAHHILRRLGEQAYAAVAA